MEITKSSSMDLRRALTIRILATVAALALLASSYVLFETFFEAGMMSLLFTAVVIVIVGILLTMTPLGRRLMEY